MADDVRQRILDAATHLFAHRGYGSTSVREVVQAAGVTKPTLYYWFGNKEGLYRDCLEAKFARIPPLVSDVVDGPGTLRERLVRFVHAYIQAGLDDIDGVRLAMTATSPSFEERPEIDLMSFHTEYFGPLGRLLDEGIRADVFRRDTDPEFAISALLGPLSLHLRGALIGMALPPDFAEKTVDLYLHGVAPR